MIIPQHPGGGYEPPQVSDDDNQSSPEVSDDEEGGGFSRNTRFYQQPAEDQEEDIFAPEIHVEDTLPKRYFAWLPGLLNNIAHSFVGGWAYVLIQYMSRMMSERHQRSTEEAIRAREEELHYMHHAATH